MNCPYCGSPVQTAGKCPNCGAPVHPDPAADRSAKAGGQPPRNIGEFIDSLGEQAQRLQQQTAQRSSAPRRPVSRRVIVTLAVTMLLVWGICGVLLRTVVFQANRTGTVSAPATPLAESPAALAFQEGYALALEEEPALLLDEEPAGPPEGTAAFQNMTREEYLQAAQPIELQEVLRNPERYGGVDLAVTMRVSQVLDYDGERVYYIGYLMLEDGSWASAMDNGALRCVFVDYREPGEAELVNNDEVILYGEFDHLREFSSALGRYEFPVLNLRYVEYLD